MFEKSMEMSDLGNSNNRELEGNRSEENFEIPSYRDEQPRQVLPESVSTSISKFQCILYICCQFFVATYPSMRLRT